MIKVKELLQKLSDVDQEAFVAVTIENQLTLNYIGLTKYYANSEILLSGPYATISRTELSFNRTDEFSIPIVYIGE